MEALKAIGWFIAMYISLVLVFHFVGMRTMVQFFPEGRRWWMLPAQLLSLGIFAAVVLYHPF